MWAVPETAAKTTATAPSIANPWYSAASVGRDRTHVLQERETNWDAVRSKTSRFVLQTSQGIYHQGHKDGINLPSALYWSYEQLVELLVSNDNHGVDDKQEHILQEFLQSSNAQHLLAWVGKLEDHDYWVCYVNDLPREQVDTYYQKSMLPTLEHDNKNHTLHQLQVAGLREFGDSLESSTDAAILATCNGMVEFHKSHPYCSKCGSRTRTAKAGASRKCTSCGASAYPRIDVASIMLITSHCEQYALLGRKQNWPQGRYSTLAGFAEIGETLEQCCARETWEESGVAVDPTSIRFVCSQPWPFPRSLMAGFRAKAMESGLPAIHVDELEMEDIQWFHRDYVRERLDGGSTALSFQPNEQEQSFHVPGKASLARILITQWANES